MLSAILEEEECYKISAIKPLYVFVDPNPDTSFQCPLARQADSEFGKRSDLALIIFQTFPLGKEVFCTSFCLLQKFLF